MIGRRRWISSMKRMSPSRRFVSVPTRSPGFSSAGPEVRADVDAELARDQLGERRLAESRRAEEERVIERLAPRQRRVDVDAQRFLHLVLADELGQPLRAERELDDALVRNDLREW